MFDITIEQKTLFKALEYLEPTVGKGNNNLGENCICMKTTGNNSIEMYTTNTIEFTRLEAIVGSGGNTIESAPLVDFKRFKAIIATIPENEFVSLKAGVNDLFINFSLRKTPLRLTGIATGMIALPNNALPQSSTISIPRLYLQSVLSDFNKMITETQSAPIYNCMRIDTSANNIEITAVDMNGHRTMARSGLATTNNPTATVLIEIAKFNKSVKIFEEFDEVELSMDNAIICANGAVSNNNTKTAGMINGISYYTRRLTGAFPANIRQNMVPLPTEFAEINIEELQKVFQRVKAIEDDASKGLVRFDANNNNVTISYNTTHGDLEDNIQLDNTISKQIATVFKYDNFGDIIGVLKTASTSGVIEIGELANFRNHFIVKAKGNDTTLFTLPAMVGANNNP